MITSESKVRAFVSLPASYLNYSTLEEFLGDLVLATKGTLSPQDRRLLWKLFDFNFRYDRNEKQFEVLEVIRSNSQFRELVKFEYDRFSALLHRGYPPSKICAAMYILHHLEMGHIAKTEQLKLDIKSAIDEFPKAHRLLLRSDWRSIFKSELPHIEGTP